MFLIDPNAGFFPTSPQARLLGEPNPSRICKRCFRPSVRAPLGPITESTKYVLHAYVYSKAFNGVHFGVALPEGVPPKDTTNLYKRGHRPPFHFHRKKNIFQWGNANEMAPTASPFIKLPLGIQNLITAHLDPSTLVSFRQTCRLYYRSLEQLEHLHEVEMLDKHRDNYACALCRSVKPETAFALRRM